MRLSASWCELVCTVCADLKLTNATGDAVTGLLIRNRPPPSGLVLARPSESSVSLSEDRLGLTSMSTLARLESQSARLRQSLTAPDAPVALAYTSRSRSGVPRRHNLLAGYSYSHRARPYLGDVRGHHQHNLGDRTPLIRHSSLKFSFRP